MGDVPGGWNLCLPDGGYRGGKRRALFSVTFTFVVDDADVAQSIVDNGGNLSTFYRCGHLIVKK